jgi:hypothetical protein
MAALPIVKMTLYKHGVGFFTRYMEQPGDTVALTFRTEEMNDVLKSLTTVARGGQVLGVDYQTPEDKASLLQRSSIQLSDEASLRDLLRDLRGRRAEVTTTAGSQAGIIVGVDLPAEREPMAATVLTLFLPERREIVPFRLADVLAVRLDDDRANADLAYFLETSLTEENKRAVTVRLSPAAEAVGVSYIAPSPVWRVSYRLVVDEESADAPEPPPAEHPERNGLPPKEAQRALLQGWALFDNTLDEDLENVEVSFVAGMPVSFIYDLYTPFTPPRPVIKEENRGVAAPVEFDAALPPAAAFGAAPEAASRGMMMMAEEAPAYGRRAKPRREDLAASTTIAATGQAQGEFFSYVVANPITVRRGRSAMAPILQADIEARKERLYNGQKHPRNPVIALRFKNATGLTLERGPLTVVEAGEYAGEAMLPFTASDSDIYLAYAVDLAMTVTEEGSAERRLESVNIQEGLLVVQEWDIQAVKYRVENRGRKPAAVTIEHPVLGGYEAFDTPEPAERTAQFYRYVVPVGASTSATFTARQRRSMYRREEIRHQNLAQLAQWLRARGLDQATYDRLAGILKLYEEISGREQELQKNAQARQKLFEQQKTIQGNLASLKDSGEEGQLRTRYARTLAEQEDRLAALDRQDDDLRKANEQTQQQIAAAIKALS